MDITVRFREVNSWLDKCFGGISLPDFKRNEQNIDLLYELMRKNMQRDQDVQFIIQDFRQKTTEYTAEGQRLSTVLSPLNLKTASLSQSGLMSLRTLVTLASLLQLLDASDSSYMLAIQALQSERENIHEILLEETFTLDLLNKKTKSSLIKHHSLSKAFKELEIQTSQENLLMEKHAKSAAFLNSKAREYSGLITKLRESLARSQADSSIFHENLVKISQKLQKMQDELEPLKRKLQNYSDLPPDIHQAKVKIVELRQKVTVVEKELAERIDLMHLK